MPACGGGSLKADAIPAQTPTTQVMNSPPFPHLFIGGKGWWGGGGMASRHPNAQDSQPTKKDAKVMLPTGGRSDYLSPNVSHHSSVHGAFCFLHGPFCFLHGAFFRPSWSGCPFDRRVSEIHRLILNSDRLELHINRLASGISRFICPTVPRSRTYSTLCLQL